jgi:hypothetical protein
VRVEPVPYGQAQAGQQHGLLGGEPGQCGLVIGWLVGPNAGCGRPEDDRVVAVGVQHAVGRVRAVQVVVECPARGHPPLVRRVVLLGQLGRVGSQQVVLLEPPWCAFGDKVGPGQFAQPRGDRGDRLAGQARGRQR